MSGTGAARPTEVLDVDTPTGRGRLFVDAAPEAASAVLLLGHGAGGGVGAADLELLARRLPSRGVTVGRFEQPWRTAGGRVAVAPPRLDQGWHGAVEFVLAQRWGAAPLFFGGRSAGARVACRTAGDYRVQGVVCLSFPLHLPGRPERSRLPELLLPAAPRLVLQGSADAFGTSDELAAALTDVPGVRLVGLAGADHSLRVSKASGSSAEHVRALLLAEVAAFILGHAGVARPGAGE